MPSDKRANTVEQWTSPKLTSSKQDTKGVENSVRQIGN